MHDRAEHRELYRSIPSFVCKEGCSDCCGPVPVTPWEAQRLGIAGQMVTPFDPKTLKCGFLQDGKCSVYDRRPFLCRLFGTVDNPRMACPHGCKPTKVMSAKQGLVKLERYRSLHA